MVSLVVEAAGLALALALSVGHDSRIFILPLFQRVFQIESKRTYHNRTLSSAVSIRSLSFSAWDLSNRLRQRSDRVEAVACA
jgi:hypothetical protein